VTRADGARRAAALVRQLLLALQFFVQTDGLILDDRVLHAQAPLELVNQLAMIRA